MIVIRSSQKSRIGAAITVLIASVGLLSRLTYGFAPVSVQTSSSHRPHNYLPTTCNPHQQRSSSPTTGNGSSTSLNVLGTDGGILGVGAPEIATILLVGYFVLGPSELYKLVKEIGKFVQNFRSLSTEATKSFESTMENQLELTELRKAQAELNDAFSFRRSINTDEMADAFEGNSFSEKTAAAEAAAAAATAASATATSEEGTTKKKRRLVRRKKKKVVEEEEEPVQEEQLDLDRQIAMEYPDLDLLEEEDSTSPEVAAKISEEDKLRAERMERLSGGSSVGDSSDTPDWFTASEEEIASKILDDTPSSPQVVDPALEAYEKNRFQSQLSAEDWNAQIMANEDKLSPLSMVMQRLAILEEEKNAADRRLEEEYERRMANEDKYYLEKRRVLEDAIEDIQRDAFTDLNGGGAGDETKEEDAVSSGGGPKFSA